MPRFELVDHTDGRCKGYMRITKDGKRVTDVFPYAAGVDAAWTIKTAHEVVERMNSLERSMAPD